MKKKLIIVFLILIVTGCTNNLEKQTDVLAETIKNLNYNYDTDLSKLNQNNKDLINIYLKDELVGNKEIILSKLELYPNDSYTEEENSKTVYIKDDKYYVKYRDLNFLKYDDDNYYANLVINHNIVTLPKAIYPLLGADTNQNINYKYRFIEKSITNNRAIYSYSSYGNGSGMQIEFTLNKNKVSNIKVSYTNYVVSFSGDTEKKQSNSWIELLVMLIVAGLLIYGGLYFYKKKTEN